MTAHFTVFIGNDCEADEYAVIDRIEHAHLEKEEHGAVEKNERESDILKANPLDRV
jgi:hypothetical protein